MLVKVLEEVQAAGFIRESLLPILLQVSFLLPSEALCQFAAAKYVVNLPAGTVQKVVLGSLDDGHLLELALVSRARQDLWVVEEQVVQLLGFLQRGGVLTQHGAVKDGPASLHLVHYPALSPATRYYATASQLLTETRPVSTHQTAGNIPPSSCCGSTDLPPVPWFFVSANSLRRRVHSHKAEPREGTLVHVSEPKEPVAGLRIGVW